MLLIAIMLLLSAMSNLFLGRRCAALREELKRQEIGMDSGIEIMEAAR